MCPFEALWRGPWLTYGKAKVYVHISNKKIIKKSNKIRYYLCSPWSKPVGSRVDSKGEVILSVGEWFLVKGGSWRFPLVHIFAWNAWTNRKLSSPCAWHLSTISSQLSLSIKVVKHCIEQPTHSFDFPRMNLSSVAKVKCLFWVIIS